MKFILVHSSKSSFYPLSSGSGFCVTLNGLHSCVGGVIQKIEILDLNVNFREP